MPMVEILRADISDAGDILALQKLAYQSQAALYDDYGLPPLIQTLEELKGQFQNHTILKAVLDNVIIGSVRAYSGNDTCYIGRLIVHPASQNKGIGKALMTAIEDSFKDARRFELYTGFKSEKSIYLYTSLGYSVFDSEKVNEKLELLHLEKVKAR